MIIVHPAISNTEAQLTRLRVRTGLQVTMGNKYLRLVPREPVRPPLVQVTTIPCNGPYFDQLRADFRDNGGRSA